MNSGIFSQIQNFNIELLLSHLSHFISLENENAFRKSFCKASIQDIHVSFFVSNCLNLSCTIHACIQLFAKLPYT